MRQLGSFFHIAMNGMAASDKIFRLLDLPEPEHGGAEVDAEHCGITCKDLRFSYEPEREILGGVDLEIPSTASSRWWASRAVVSPPLPPSSWGAAGAIPAASLWATWSCGELDEASLCAALPM